MNQAISSFKLYRQNVYWAVYR